MCSYTLPSLITNAKQQCLEAAKVLCGMREECICEKGDDLFLAVGLWIEDSRLSEARRRFAASDIESQRWIFKEWGHEDFTCTIIFRDKHNPLIFWGGFLSAVLFWCPGVLEVEFSKFTNTIEVRSIRRRHIFAFMQHCKGYASASISRPLLRGSVHPRSISLTDVNI